jgi:hypothetical protein
LSHGTNNATLVEEITDARTGGAVNLIACTVHDIGSDVVSVQKTCAQNVSELKMEHKSLSS